MNETVGVDAIEYPALGFSQGTVWVISGCSDLTTATEAGLRSGYFDNLTIVDLNGLQRRVSGVTIVRRCGFLWSRYLVNPVLESGQTELSTDQVRKRVLTALDHPSWSSVYGVQEIQQRVLEASSIAELIEALNL